VKRRFSSWVAGILFCLSGGCVDKISFDTGDATIFPIVITGSITDQPGPYEIEVSQGFDLEAQAAVRESVPAKRIILSDDIGNFEVLTEIETGKYVSRPDGMRGVVGRAYKLRVELYDGRVYETIPDTMKTTGIVTDIRHSVVKYNNADGKPEYGFDIFFDSKSEKNNEFRFLWDLVMTYEISTNPEVILLPCSGMIMDPNFGMAVSVFPCECCYCWIQDKNRIPIVSDGALLKNGVFSNIKAGRLPITWQTMGYKTYVEIQQYSLSEMAFNFWKAVRNQKDAATSLFQPLSGKINGNFFQVEGKTSPVQGLFYASSVSKKAINITIKDVPDPKNMITLRTGLYTGPCMDFPRATNRKPDFWE